MAAFDEMMELEDSIRRSTLELLSRRDDMVEFSSRGLLYRTELSALERALATHQKLLSYLKGEARVVALSEYQEVKRTIEHHAELIGSRRRDLKTVTKKSADNQALIGGLEKQIAKETAELEKYGRVLEFAR